jgi:hypothetical protein
MKTTLQRRLELLSGLLLLALLVFAIGIQAAQADPLARVGTTPGNASTTPAPGTQGRGGVALVPSAPASGVQDSWSVMAATSGTSSSSGTSSTSYWIIGAAAAVIIAGIGAWALLRRRRQPASAAYCARHPEDSLCGAA